MPLRWRNVFTTGIVASDSTNGNVAMADALSSFPVGLFVAEATT
jgi:hypothetical protein